MVLLAFFVTIKSKVYYLGAAYPVLLAAGGVYCEEFFNRQRLRYGIPISSSALAVGGLLLLPLSLPVLSIERFRDYAGHFRFLVSNSKEVVKDYYDMFGWEEMVKTVAKVYSSLDSRERRRCCILTANYGEAGAVDLFGPKFGLPRAISGHNSYYYWGCGRQNPETIITVGIPKEVLADYCRDVDEAAVFSPSVPDVGERNVPICVCRELDRPLNEIWPYVRHFD